MDLEQVKSKASEKFASILADAVNRVSDAIEAAADTMVAVGRANLLNEFKRICAALEALDAEKTDTFDALQHLQHSATPRRQATRRQPGA